MNAWEGLSSQNSKCYNNRSEYSILIGWLTNVKHFSVAYLQSRHCSSPWEKQQWRSPLRVRRALSLSPVPFISKDRDIVGVDWFDVLMHCLKMGSTKWRRPVWCVSIGGHEKSHLAPEPGVSAAGGFEGPRGAGRWLHWCHRPASIQHDLYIFKVSYTSPTPCVTKSRMAIKEDDQLLSITMGWYI